MDLGCCHGPMYSLDCRKPLAVRASGTLTGQQPEKGWHYNRKLITGKVPVGTVGASESLRNRPESGGTTGTLETRNGIQFF